MKINIDGELVCELSLSQKKVIQDEISTELFDPDMKRRVKYIIEHKYEQCFKKLKDEWEPKLTAKGFKSVPTDKDEFAQLVFAQPDYMDRDARDVRDKELLGV